MIGKWLSGRLIPHLVSWLSNERHPKPFPMCDFTRLRHEIRLCDVILVEGRSRVSDVIKAVTQSPWSHAALYIGRLHDIEDPFTRDRIKNFFDGQPDTQLIVESQIGLGTVVRPLNTYDKDHLRICRPRELAYEDSQRVIRYAVSRLGIGYDIRQIIDLLRFLFPWSLMPRRWRSSLFNYHPGKATRTVCSTMIAEAFSYIQFPILPLLKRSTDNSIQLFMQNPRLCTPSDFDYSPYFDIIKYPFMDFNDNARYRLMPWTGNSALDEEEAKFYLHADTFQYDATTKQFRLKVEEHTIPEASEALTLTDKENDASDSDTKTNNQAIDGEATPNEDINPLADAQALSASPDTIKKLKSKLLTKALRKNKPRS